MTNLFSVIGEHREHPDRLLLRGEDGRFYALQSPGEEPGAIVPGPEWRVDRELPGEPELLPHAIPDAFSREESLAADSGTTTDDENGMAGAQGDPSGG